MELASPAVSETSVYANGYAASIFCLDTVVCLYLTKKESNLELRFYLLRVGTKNRFLIWYTHFDSG